jgi:hypothetical protein
VPAAECYVIGAPVARRARHSVLSSERGSGGAPEAQLDPDFQGRDRRSRSVDTPSRFPSRIAVRASGRCR